MTTRLSKAKVGRRSTLVLHRSGSKKGHNGFEDLRDLIKTGEDYCKEVAAVLQERADLEATYSRGLMKVAGKLLKASKESSGTVPNAWYFVSNDFEQSAEIHKTVAHVLQEEIAKPLKSFVENQHKSRKAIESSVDKKHKQYTEWKTSQTKAKTRSYISCKENEKVQDQMLDCKLGRGRVLSDKENLKLDTKRKKSETGVRKSDMEYYTSCIKTERSRLEWESSIIRGSATLRRLEEDRLSQLANRASQYLNLMEESRPKLKNLTEQLREPVSLCDVRKDVASMEGNVDVNSEGGEGMGNQVLPTFYCEDLVNVMNRERRREALVKFVSIVKADIEREKKGMAGVENLAKALQETPKFGGEESQQEVQEKLQHMATMLTYLEATRYKLLNTMLELEGRPRVNHPMSGYIEQSKDKQGLAQSLLRIPNWMKNDPPTMPSELDVDWSDRGSADGGVADMWAASPSNRSPHLHSGPSFTTTNPILYSSKAEEMLRARGHADGSRSEEDDFHPSHHHHHHHHPQLTPSKSNSPGGQRNGLNFGAIHHHHRGTVGHTRSADAFRSPPPFTASTMAVVGGSNGGPRPEPILNGDYEDCEAEDNLPDSDFDEFDDSAEEEDLSRMTAVSGSTQGGGGMASHTASVQSASSSSASSSSSVSTSSSASSRTRTSEKTLGTPTGLASYDSADRVEKSPAENSSPVVGGYGRPSDDLNRRYLEIEEEEEEISDHTANSQDNEIHEIYYQEKQVAVIGRCRAMYDYNANMYDELTIRYGDIINIHDKQEDGWWLGECQGKVGIFPATYVELM